MKNITNGPAQPLQASYPSLPTPSKRLPKRYILSDDFTHKSITTDASRKRQQPRTLTLVNARYNEVVHNRFASWSTTISDENSSRIISFIPSSVKRRCKSLQLLKPSSRCSTSAGTSSQLDRVTEGKSNYLVSEKGITGSCDTHIIRDLDVTKRSTKLKSEPRAHQKANSFSDGTNHHRLPGARSSTVINEEPNKKSPTLVRSSTTPGKGCSVSSTLPLTENRAKVNTLRPLLRSYRSSPIRSSQRTAHGDSTPTVLHASHTPDRFIPNRQFPDRATETFLASKKTSQLTDEERHFRHGNKSPSPFGSQLRRSSRGSHRVRHVQRAPSRSSQLVIANQTLDPSTGSVQRETTILNSRHFSSGTVWNVGGPTAASDVVFGIPTGRGDLLSSGSNAPFYTSMFFKQPDREGERDTHERRLALALGIDRTSRVLHTSASSSAVLAGSSVSPEKSISRLQVEGHVWLDSEWVQKGSFHSWYRIDELISHVILTRRRNSLTEA